jgi:hypothetical protein
MIRYEGSRTKAGPVVTVNGEPLDLRLDLRNDSPTGFEWGYGGSGSAQLALALLADHTQAAEQALNLYQRFKWMVVAELPHTGWTLTTRQIDQIIQCIRDEDAKGECRPTERR